MIDAQDRLPRRKVRVAGHTMSTVDVGHGPSIVLLHGNMTYSYMWRNVIPYLAQSHRCFAPDLLGMGRSDLIFPSGADTYSFQETTDYLDLFIEIAVPEGPVIVIGHELGASHAIRFARIRPDRVIGLILIEGVFRLTNEATLPERARDLLLDARGNNGEHTVLLENALIEKYLPMATMRSLGPNEKEAYREPYLKPGEARRAMLSMIRQLPLQEHPGPIDDLIEQSRLWCAQSEVPKLVIGGQPGFLVPPAVLGTAARWANTTVATVRGSHFLAEDSPARLTALILDWLAEIGYGN